MLGNTVRLWNTVVKLKPEFSIPPSDPDPIHHFSTRTRRSANNISSYPSGTSFNSLASPQRPSNARAGPSTPRKPLDRRTCCCACHGPGPVSPKTPGIHTSTPVNTGPSSRSINRMHFEERSSKHRREPSVRDSSPMKSSSSFREMKPQFSARKHKAAEQEISVSELGELSIRVRRHTGEKMRIGTYSRMKASFKSWTSSNPQPARLAKRLTHPPPEVKRPSVRSKVDACRRSGLSTHTAHAKSAGSSFLSMPDRADTTTSRREPRGTDGKSAFVNRFGWPLAPSRKSGKGSCSTVSVPARPEQSALTDRRLPPRPRASFEVDLSPIMEDVHSLPSLGNADSVLDGVADQNAANITYQDQDQDQDNDSRNFDHMNLSGSFVLQSTSCRDITAHDPHPNDEDSVPMVVLTFPTPEPPKSPLFAPQSPFTVHKFVAATTLGDSASENSIPGTSNLTVPALPRCTQCGFGFGLDLYDLEASISGDPCRFCEPQWLACKMWYQARGNTLREPCAVRPAESNASSRAIVGKLGLPIGSHRGLGIGIDTVDELGQRNNKQARAHAKTVGEGYTRFANANIQAVWTWIPREPNRKDEATPLGWTISTRVNGGMRHVQLESSSRKEERTPAKRRRFHRGARFVRGVLETEDWDLYLACAEHLNR
ncbi:hypothetical protein DFH06DRAFT_1299869 [Mycena polygramma]|nr:hypothetical protein DFH06DRAFT_1299869 [Mycena polygramma]